MIGADPEFFVQKNGRPFPIVGLLGGDKYESVERWDIGPLCGYLEDNVMAEFTITPSRSATEFVDMNTKMMDVIMKELGDEFQPLIVPAVRFPEEHLQSEQAKVFGCMPDHNAYTLDIQKVSADKAGNLRTAGGHIHIGYAEAEGNLEEAATIARAFDLFVVLPMMLIEPDNERRQLYGKAGSFRLKDYGVECRQLSCFWLSSPQLMEFVYEQTVKAVRFVEENEKIRDPKSDLSQKIRSIIDDKLMGDIIPILQEFGLEEVVSPKQAEETLV